MLAGLPSLQDLYCLGCKVIGDIKSLRVLKDTIASVDIMYCPGVRGNFMDLADFPHLENLDLDDTFVTGDIREIGKCDFSLLKYLDLPSSVYGGNNFIIQRISDAQHIVDAIYELKKQHPNLQLEQWNAQLSEDSPDWYEGLERDGVPMPPFCIVGVKSGSRLGWRWIDREGCYPCEVNWQDPEPDKGSIEYEKYIQDLAEVDEKLDVFKELHQPPTVEEYDRILSEKCSIHIHDLADFL